MARTDTDDDRPEVVALHHRLERIVDATVDAILEHEHPVDVADDAWLARLLIGVRQQDAALADRAWWRVETAAAARALELAEMVSAQTAAAADYLNRVAAEDEDGFTELAHGGLLYGCPVDGCEFVIGVTGNAGVDDEDDVQAVIDFHEQVFAHEALHEAPEPELPQQRPAGDDAAPVVLNDTHRHADGYHDAEDAAQAAYLAAWASAPQRYRRAVRGQRVGILTVLLGVVLCVVYASPVDGRTLLGTIAVAVGGTVALVATRNGHAARRELERGKW